VVARSDGETVVMAHDLARSIEEKLRHRAGGLWDAREVARFLGVHRNWVYLQAESGSLPCVRIGGLLRFEPETIRAIARGSPIKGGRVVALPVSHPRKERK
jgi:excisionase family DNA binding protein